MLKFLLNRIIQASIVMFVISIIAFSIQGNLGDPMRELSGMSVSEAEREAIRDKLGLNDPFLVQFMRFIGNAVQGDFGTSYFFKRPAIDVILEKLPATLELVFASTLIIVVLSVPLGVYSAIHPKALFSKIVMSVSMLGLSIPVFLTAIMLIFIFAINLELLPSFGRGEVVHVFGYWHTNYLTKDGLLHIILPAVSLSSIMLPLFIRLIRAEMLEVLSSEYVRFAKAKGLKPKTVYYKHALKNTMLPVITVGGFQIGTMVAYTILTETVFQWPGMGFMFLEAVKRSDIPLITTYLMVVGLIFVITNTLVDLLYGIINPTVSLTKNK
ncbi:MAG: ABC transporter permease [Alphaproteobacteria bacterium]